MTESTAVYDHLQIVATASSTFVERVGALLDEVLRISHEDPTAVLDGDRRRELIEELVEAGVASGELAALDRCLVTDTVTAILSGVMLIRVLAPEAQGVAIQGFKRLLAGTLLQRSSDW